jgi:ABC-type sugar transport system substrate-binding protein
MAVSLLVVLGLAASACGDDDEDDTGTGATEATDATEATSSATQATTGATTGDGGAEGIDLEQAAAIVEEFSVRPTEIPNTTPIEGEIPTGKRVYFISCGAPACEAEIPILQEAAEILEWELTAISTDPTKPEQITAAWDRVVNEKPDALLYTATPRSQVASQFEAAAANGTVLVACCTTDPPEDGLAYVLSTPEQTGELGRIIAAWVVDDAAGEPAHALYLDLPDFPILSALRTDFEASLEELCTPCTHDAIEFGLADLATASDQVVSYLRAHPDVKYVIQSTDSTFSLPAALEAAGLDDIRIFGEGPTSATLADIDAGRQAGTMAFAFWEIMFSMMDAAARSFVGQEIERPDPPNWILTAGTFPTGVDTFPLVEDVVEQYKALWGK